MIEISLIDRLCCIVAYSYMYLGMISHMNQFEKNFNDLRRWFSITVTNVAVLEQGNFRMEFHASMKL